LSQASPALIRILQVIEFIGHHMGQMSHFLLKIHILLGLSWEELRAMFYSLRTLLGEDQYRFIEDMSIVALDPILSPVSSESILWM
jgi:hypothetical protein